MIVDVSVAFMHAPINERVIVEVPKGVQSTIGYSLLKKALNGTREASKMWTDHSAGIPESWGAFRNDHNPAVFRLENPVETTSHL
jgi:hypothetical protein